MFISTPRVPVALRVAAVALLALVLLPLTLLTFSGSARADDAGDAAGRTAAVPVTVANASFDQGTRHWRAYGAGARLASSRLGHRDGHAVALVSPRNRPAGLRQVSTSAPVTVKSGRVTASVWVWTPTARRVVVAVRPSHGAAVARTAALVKARRWQRVAVAHRVTNLDRSRLTLDVHAAQSPRAGRVLVDDAALQLVRVVASNAGPQAPGTWMSGAAGNGVANGDFAAWRGASVPIAGTWNDSFDAQTNQWSLQRGLEYGAWKGDMDNAVGAIYADRGETWAQAANGAYDARWRIALTALKVDWAGRPGTMFIRFAHEFNGDWYAWKVTGSQTSDFKAAWRRFRTLQQQIFPQSKLVFCPNSVTSASNNLDWRDAFPGKQYVDVLAVDWYNTKYGFIKDSASFASRLTQTETSGAPVGLESHRLFAKSQGLPFAISEWSSDGVEGGDSPAFIKSFHAWLAQHGGTGPGEVLYEILFNVGEFQGAKYQLFPTAKQPSATEAYRQGW